MPFKKYALFGICLLMVAVAILYWHNSFRKEDFGGPISSTTTTCADYLSTYTIKSGAAVNILDAWFLELLEIRIDQKTCRLALYNEAKDQYITFWATESEYVRDGEQFGTHGLKVVSINEDSITVERRWGTIEMK